MHTMIVLAACGLVVLVGRNDGSPLAAMAQKTSRGAGLWVPLVIVAALPVAPLLGFSAVASSLGSMFSAGDPGGSLALLVAVLLTVGLSVRLSVPTSITLALVGALAGTVLGSGASPDWPYVGRVLALAAVAPVLACLASWTLSRLPVRLPTGADRTHSILGAARKTAFAALSLAYSANDGQKVTFAMALAFQVQVGTAAQSWWIQGVAVLLFASGLLLGLRSSGRALRHGVFSPDPINNLWSQVGAAVVIGAGSAAGTPLSMTQALTGAVLGTGLVRGRQVVRWRAAGKIVVAWLWTLPLATLLAFGLTEALSLLPAEVW